MRKLAPIVLALAAPALAPDRRRSTNTLTRVALDVHYAAGAQGVRELGSDSVPALVSEV